MSKTVVIEVLADGGIRLTTPEGETGLAALQTTLDWVAEANREGMAVHLRGRLNEPAVVEVVGQVRRLASALHEVPSEPAAWPKRRSSLQTAAAGGLIDQVTDLLGRGSSAHKGGWHQTPYRLAMQRGHTEVLVALRDAGVNHPHGLTPPAVLPHAVVLRAYPPSWLWWSLVPFGVLAIGATVGGAYAAIPIFLILPLAGIGTVHLVLSNTRCAVDGPSVARRRGRNWQGPVDLRTLDALGRTPPGTVRMPELWVLGQRKAGDRPDVYVKSAFDKEQRTTMTQMAGLCFVPLYAAGDFMSPGFERLVARHLNPANTIVGELAEDRIWPGRTERPG
ncbi:MAG: hypothetical protein ABWY68_05180 [Cryobacterium sp.]